MSESPHSKCQDCGIDLETSEDAAVHRDETFQLPGAKMSHTTLVLNPTEDERIKNLIQDTISMGIDKTLEELDGLIYRGKVSEGDVDKVMARYYDFQDAWDDWKAESE